VAICKSHSNRSKSDGSAREVSLPDGTSAPGLPLPTVAPSPTTVEGRRTDLDSYARWVATRELLPADQTLRIARQIAALEICVWEHVLAHTPAIEIARGVFENVGGDPSLAQSLISLQRTTTTLARANSTAVRRRELAVQRRRLARQLRARDVDRSCQQTVLAQLPVASGNEDHGKCRRGRTGALPRLSDRSSTTYTKVRRAEQSAARARTRLAEGNLRLVIAIARRYRDCGLPLIDLIQEGNIGLLKAIDRFDFRLGFRFSTYATWWIRHRVSRYVAEKAETVRLPVHVREARSRLSRAEHELRSATGRQPSSDELSEASGLSRSRVELVLQHGSERLISLDAPLPSDSKGTLRGEVFRSPEQELTPFDQLMQKQEAHRVRAALRILTPRERHIICARFGLQGKGDSLTLREIGAQLHLSRERVRQLEAQAIKTLRSALK